MFGSIALNFWIFGGFGAIFAPFLPQFWSAFLIHPAASEIPLFGSRAKIVGKNAWRPPQPRLFRN